jgi:hypothetical protein
MPLDEVIQWHGRWDSKASSRKKFYGFYKHGEATGRCRVVGSELHGTLLQKSAGKFLTLKGASSLIHLPWRRVVLEKFRQEKDFDG